jgi:hypothetical protein
VGGGSKRNFFSSPVLKVCRQCPLLLVVEVCLREGKALGSKEKGKVSLVGCGFYY